MTSDELQALEELARKAAQGPWIAGSDDFIYSPSIRIRVVRSSGDVESLEKNRSAALSPTMLFIAETRIAVPVLCLELRAAWDKIDKLKSADKEWFYAVTESVT